MSAIPGRCSECGRAHTLLEHFGWPPRIRRVPAKTLMTRVQVEAFRAWRGRRYPLATPALRERR